MSMQVGDAGKDGDPIMDINTTPLIDVMLVLLIMLIITIPPQTHAVVLDMPIGDPPPPLFAPPPPIRLTVDFDGTIYWNADIVDRQTMDEYMRRLSAQPFEQQNELHILPHKRTKYGDVAAVMAMAQRNHLTKIGVIGGVK